MITYPNQKTITIKKDAPKRGEVYLRVRLDNLEKAARELSGEVALKLYLYFAANQDNYELIFSPQDFAAKYNVSVDRARKVFHELEKAGYLEKISNTSYMFYEGGQAIS